MKKLRFMFMEWASSRLATNGALLAAQNGRSRLECSGELKASPAPPPEESHRRTICRLPSWKSVPLYPYHKSKQQITQPRVLSSMGIRLLFQTHFLRLPTGVTVL